MQHITIHNLYKIGFTLENCDGTPMDLSTSTVKFILKKNKSDMDTQALLSAEYVNPNTHPNIINELDPNGVTDIRNGLNSPTFAVFCDGKVRLVDAINDCFNCDMDQLELYQTFTPIANKTESAFINSIIDIR